LALKIVKDALLTAVILTTTPAVLALCMLVIVQLGVEPAVNAALPLNVTVALEAGLITPVVPVTIFGFDKLFPALS